MLCAQRENYNALHFFAKLTTTRVTQIRVDTHLGGKDQRREAKRRAHSTARQKGASARGARGHEGGVSTRSNGLQGEGKLGKGGHKDEGGSDEAQNAGRQVELHTTRTESAIIIVTF